MPYRRRRRYNRRRGRRVRAPNKWAWYAKMAWKGLKMVKGLINVEKHYTDTSISLSTTTAGALTLLTGIAQGDDVSNRQGNSVLAKTLYGRLLIYRDATNAIPTNYVRVMLIKDLQNQGTNPTVTDILQSASTTSPLNVDHTSRYVILMDKNYLMSENGKQGVALKFYKKLNCHLKFTGANSTDIYTNAVYLLLIGDQSANSPDVSGDIRLGFYDN